MTGTFISRLFEGSDLLYRVPALLLAITLHEVAHGFVAYRLGDPTAKAHGRLTLNPLAHLDPVGLLALWLVGFGWAKPVPVNSMYFKGNRRRGMFFVGLAGPATNFILAFVTYLLLSAFPAVLRIPHIPQILFLTFIYNIFLGVFNLLPVPPLDGSKILAYFLPVQTAYRYSQYEQYGPLVLILLIFTGTLTRILHPMANAAGGVIIYLADLITGII